MKLVRAFSPHPGPLPWGEGELFAARLKCACKPQFVSHTKFHKLSDRCSLSPRERVRVRGNEIFK